MAQRSPNCPQITFQEAIEKGRKIYEKEHTHAATKVVVANDLGYSGINGRSLSLIGALRQYGILEGAADALKVSDDAVAYYVMDDGTEKQEATQRMVLKPSLFSELYQQFGGENLPSEGNLKHILVKRGFLSDAADEVIRVYRANVELVLGKNQGYNEGAAVEEEDRPMSAAPKNESPSVVGINFDFLGKSPTKRTYPLDISIPRSLKAELSISGEFKQEDLERLKTQIGRLIDNLQDAFAD